MKNISKRTKVILFGLLILLAAANMNTIVDYLDYADHALIREMRLVSEQNFHEYPWVKENAVIDEEQARKINEEQASKRDKRLGAVVLKHIPLGTSAEVAMEICQQNGFKVKRSDGVREPMYLGFEGKITCYRKDLKIDSRYLLAADKYVAVAYFKNGKVGAVAGLHRSQILSEI